MARRGIRYEGKPRKVQGGYVIDAYVKRSDGQTKRIKRTAKTAAACKAAFEQARAAFEQSGTLYHAPDTLKSLFDRWLDHVRETKTRPNTIATYHYILKLCSPIETLLITQLNQSTQAFHSLFRTLTKEYQPSTLNLLYSTLHCCLQWAMDMRWLDRLPLPRKQALIGLSKAADKPKTYTIEQLKALGEAAQQHKDPRAIIAMVLGLSGLRVGEVAGLQWADIDMQSGIITVQRTVLPKLKIGPCKSGKARRFKLNPAVVGQLARYREQCETLFHQLPMYVIYGMEPDLPRAPQQIAQQFLRCQAQAGIDQRLTFHALRHTAATLAAHDNVPLVQIQHALGHASITMTSQYLHEVNDQQYIMFDQFTPQFTPKASSDAE